MVEIGGGRADRRHDQRRRRLVIGGTVVGVLAVVALVVVGIVVLTAEDEPSTSPTASSRRTTTSSTSASTTTTTIAVPTTPVPRSSNVVVALAQQYDGHYVGTWSNTTSGTTGPAILEVRIDPNAGTLAVAIQLDGGFFGSGAKEFGRVESTISIGDPNAPVTTETERLGTVTARLDQSLALIVEAPDVPDGKVKSFTLTGGLGQDRKGFDSTYTITFENGTTAPGTITVTCAPENQRPSEVATLCSL